MKRKYILFSVIVSSLLLSCKKDFLEKKPDKGLLVPVTLTDFQALLDNSELVMNYAPNLSVVSTDDSYITDGGFAAAQPVIQHSYLWAKDIYGGETVSDWNRSYQQVFYTNVVLEGLKDFNVDSASSPQVNVLEGTALFHRAFAFYNIAQQFAAPYDSLTAAEEPGIPIRLTADINEKSERGTLKQTYDQLIHDLQQAAELLPEQVAFKTRPSRMAAKALLARVYLSMEDYAKAFRYADTCLKANHKLIDYNTLDPAAARPVPADLPYGNDEVLFHAILTFTPVLAASAATGIDSVLYQSYADKDLRKSIFFRDRGNGIITFKANYTGTFNVFAGLATDELYLIRAECYARANNAGAAMDDLNTLLQKRWETGTFVSYTAGTPEEALTKILDERRKELLYRNLRWSDLRRLNKDPRFAVTIKRVINGQSYTLPPGDPRYVFPIPDDVIAGSGIEQNPR